MPIYDKTDWVAGLSEQRATGLSFLLPLLGLVPGVTGRARTRGDSAYCLQAKRLDSVLLLEVSCMHCCGLPLGLLQDSHVSLLPRPQSVNGLHLARVSIGVSSLSALQIHAMCNTFRMGLRSS
jgi:hypothetical protein